MSIRLQMIILALALASLPAPQLAAAEPIAPGAAYSRLAPEERFYRDPRFPPGYSNPQPHVPVPQNPFLAAGQTSNMHNDSYMSDAYEVSGPLGLNPEVRSRRMGAIAQCVTITFDQQGRLVMGCTKLDHPSILLLDPGTLEVLARYEMPGRKLGRALDPIGILEDTSGGAYFYLDHQDRVVVATRDKKIEIIAAPSSPEEGFRLVKSYDLTAHVVTKRWPAEDKVGSVLPDWEGRLWYVTRYGMVGVVDPGTGAVHTTELAGEEVQNSFTVGEDGVYIISSHALYRLRADEGGRPVIDWRSEYDRGARRKPGQIHQGSGTTPTLAGGLIGIMDNAEPRMNMVFLRRSDGREVCSAPVFAERRSASENSLIGFQRADGAYSFIAESNYGYKSFFSAMFGRMPEPGMARVDVIADGGGGFECREVWTVPVMSNAVPKMSLGNGLIYTYGKDGCRLGRSVWHFRALDFETGETVYKLVTGSGARNNINWAPITLSPDGTAYMGCLSGFIVIKDGNE